MKRYILLLAACIPTLTYLGAQTPAPAPLQPPEKRRIAVLDFQYTAVMSSVQTTFGGNQDVGRGISDLLIDKLVKGGTYRVIERAEISKIMAEQNFSNSDRADSATAAKIGRLLGVDSVIVGDVTQFGRADHNTSGLGNALSNWDRYGVGRVKVGKSKAIVGVTARLIDVNTGEVIASETGRGQSSKADSSLTGSGGAASSNGGVDMSSSSFSQSIIGEAVSIAIDDLAGKMEADAVKIPRQVIQVNALVADATGNSITINAGTRGGVKLGDHLIITRVSKVIKDPVTSKTLRTVEAPVGDLQITSVDESSAVGTFSGAGSPQVGDKVKNP